MNTAGTTRDRQYGKAEWCGREFSVIDTGGWVVNSDDTFESEINRQVDLAIREADVVMLVVDVNEGVTQFDMEVAHLLRQAKKPTILCVNKVDTFENQYGAAEFYKLGLGEPFILSAENGLGTGDLLDEVVSRFRKEDDSDEQPEELPRFAIVGRPNAGKSSILNAFIGEERTIVTDIPGTTRDSIYTRYNKFGKDFYLVDTARIRKKAKVTEDQEYYSVVRSIRAIENSDVCILMIDATRGIEAQDLNIYSLIQKNKKGLVVCINKWDLVEKETGTLEKMRKEIMRDLSFMSYAPVLFISALTGQRTDKLFELINYVSDQNSMRITTGMLNDVLADAQARVQPPTDKGRRLKVYYITQTGVKPPTFVVFCNSRELFHFSYQRYLENQIRGVFGLEGTPVRMVIRQKGESD